MPETRAAEKQPQQDLAAETATKASRGQRAAGSTARSTHITREQATLTAQLHPSHSQASLVMRGPEERSRASAPGNISSTGAGT